MVDYATIKKQVADILAENKVTYSASFVPFTQSRNAKPDTPIESIHTSKLSLNWQTTLKRGPQSFTTDYMQGIGHIPHHKHPTLQSMDTAEVIRRTVETGYTHVLGGWQGIRKGVQLSSPDVADVLSCLLNDADALNFATFEDWANETGYDSDSRNAERIYQTCLAIGLKLRAMLGEKLMQQLHELTCQL